MPTTPRSPRYPLRSASLPAAEILAEESFFRLLLEAAEQTFVWRDRWPVLRLGLQTTGPDADQSRAELDHHLATVASTLLKVAASAPPADYAPVRSAMLGALSDGEARLLRLRAEAAATTSDTPPALPSAALADDVFRRAADHAVAARQDAFVVMHKRYSPPADSTGDDAGASFVLLLGGLALSAALGGATLFFIVLFALTLGLMLRRTLSRHTTRGQNRLRCDQLTNLATGSNVVFV